MILEHRREQPVALFSQDGGSQLKLVRGEKLLLKLRTQLMREVPVVLDELGYVPTSKAGAETLFDVVGNAYERPSLVITTNLRQENYSEVRGSERLTDATLDRLPHVAISLEREGQLSTAGRSPTAWSEHMH